MKVLLILAFGIAAASLAVHAVPTSSDGIEVVRGGGGNATDHWTDHRNGIRSQWRAVLSDPYLDPATGETVRLVSYGFDLFPVDSRELLSTSDLLDPVRSNGAEVLQWWVAGTQGDLDQEQDGICRYTIRVQPAPQLSWGQVSSQDDLQVTVTMDLVQVR